MKKNAVPVIVIGLLMGMVLFSGIGVCDSEERLLVTDSSAPYINRLSIPDLSTIDNNGTCGSGDNQFISPYDVWVDDTYMYITDTWNHRIKKHYRDNYTFVSEIGTQGSGNDQFEYPSGVTGDDTYLYIADRDNNRIKKHLKSDLSFHSLQTGINVSLYLWSNNTHLYITIYGDNNITILLKNDLSYVSSFGTTGSGNNQFDAPNGITGDDTYLYVCDSNNNRIKKHFKNNGTYVSQIGSLGSGNDQFHYPCGITTNETCLFVCDLTNDRLKVHKKSDLSYVNQTAFTSPRGGDWYETFDPSCTDCEWNQTSYNTSSGYQFNFTIIDPQTHLYYYEIDLWSYIDGALDTISITDPVNDTNITGIIDPSWNASDIGAYVVCYYLNHAHYGDLCYNDSNISDQISCTDAEWNQTSYTTNTPYQFNFTITNPQPASYTYRFWIYSSEQSALVNSAYIADPVNYRNLTGTINPCWTPQAGLSGQIACYFINGTFKEVLDSDTTDISPVGYDYPITDDLSFNETTYDVTTVNQTYNLTYNVSNPQVSCFKYEMHLIRCLDATCSLGGLSIRNATLNASNTSVKGKFFTTDVEGYYKSAIIIFDNYDNVMSNHESSIVFLSSSVKPDYYLHYDKRHYNVSEGVVLEYASITPYNSSIEMMWIGRTVFDANYALYETLTFSGNIYRVFDKPGRYMAWMNLDGWNAVAFDECYVHEATNGVYIAEDVYHYPGHSYIDIIVSSPTHDDLYAVVYNPSDIMIATIHIESSDYVYGISNKTYLIQPTDLSGLYTIGLRTTPTDTNIDSDTCYCQIGDLMTPEIWFVPDKISQGDMMNLWYYTAWGENWTLYLTDPLGIAIGDSLFVDRTDPSVPNFGKLSYQTSPTINTGVYWGKAYNESGSSETAITTTCNISAGVYDPDAPLLTGVDAFLNVVDVAGFGSTTGKLVIAILIILVVGYMLGKALDAKSQIILISVLIIGFVAIGFIPVWVLVIIALVVGAVITFNLNNG